jgi:hypothetical protein
MRIAGLDDSVYMWSPNRLFHARSHGWFFVRQIVISFLVVTASVCTADAHHPPRADQPVRPRIDVIGPVGNRLPTSYRRRYNRPRYLGGKLAYTFVPTSQEAMAWHAAEHRGDYRHQPGHDKPGRSLPVYFYPKPYEVLPMGTRSKPVEPARN